MYFANTIHLHYSFQGKVEKRPQHDSTIRCCKPGYHSIEGILGNGNCQRTVAYMLYDQYPSYPEYIITYDK